MVSNGSFDYCCSECEAAADEYESEQLWVSLSPEERARITESLRKGAAQRAAEEASEAAKNIPF